MPEDTPGEEQPLMLSFAEAADRLVKDKIAESMTAEGLRRLARDPLSGWPIGPGDYRVVGKTRTLPYELLAPYMRSRKRGRGPAKQPRKKRTIPPKQPGENVTTTVDARRELYAFAMEGKEHSPDISEKASEKIDAFRAALLREAAQHLYTALFPAVYDDMGQKAAEGVNRAVSELHRMADEADASTEGPGIPDHTVDEEG